MHTLHSTGELDGVPSSLDQRPPIRARMRSSHNLEYFSEDYDKECEMEPRPKQTREVTPPLRMRPSKARAEENGRREMNLPPLLAAHLGRNENGQPLQSSLTSVHGGRQSSINIGGNLPPNGTLLSHHAQPFIPSSAHVPNGFVPTHVNPYSQPSAGIINGQTPSFPFQAQTGNPSIGEPLSTLHKEGLFADPTGSVTPFVRWIEDYPLPDGLKMPSHVGSYDGKGDPDNFLHLFEGAIRMQKWLMPVACHMFTYTLKDSARIWWNSQKAGSILNYEDLKAKFRSHFSQQKRFTKTHLAVHSIKQREGESVRAFATRYTDDTLQILGLHEDQRISGFVHGITLKVQGSPPRTTAGDILVETASKVDLKVLLVGFSGGKSWVIGEVLLEITIAMQKIGMVVSTIHGAVKFHTIQGIGTVFSTHKFDKIGEGVKKILETSLGNTKGVLSYTDAEEKIVVNSKYLEQAVTIGKQMPEHFKERTITVDGKPFNTEQKLNEYSHIKPVKQKRRSLGPDHSTAACKEVEELTRAGILREATHQT
ncbi:reverse transcriptase domain-containing protein [Tanacetum coccineum]